MSGALESDSLTRLREAVEGSLSARKCVCQMPREESLPVPIAVFCLLLPHWACRGPGRGLSQGVKVLQSQAQ